MSNTLSNTRKTWCSNIAVCENQGEPHEFTELITEISQNVFEEKKQTYPAKSDISL